LHADPHKIWIVGSTEFASMLRTKSFLVGIMLLPIITGASILIQLVVAQRVDTRTRTLEVIDRSAALYPFLTQAAQAYNSQAVNAQGKAVRPRIEVSKIDQEIKGEVDPALVLELSDRIRRGELDAFAVIPAAATDVPTSKTAKAPALEFHSDNPNDDLLRNWLTAAINGEVRSRRFRSAGIDQSIADRVDQPLSVENLGLFDRALSAPGGGVAVKAAQKVDPIRTMLVPAVLMFAVFFVIMTSAPQLLNSVLEEKMSKISEVLLGSITPFELMMGKLLGNVGIALLLAALYVGSGYGVATYYGYADVVSPSLMMALGVFLFLAIVLYGSLYMAVGAACSELKDAQSLMMPVMLLSMFPTFVWVAVLKSPSSPLAVGLALFPPASPFLMLMRMAMRPAPPFWQVGLSIVLCSLTSLFCVWVAAKIFRTGLLMQGKSPSYRELARWVFAK
jgi:ABC-2 type transport system permease protein